MNQTTQSRVPNNKNKVPCRYKLVLYFNEQELNNEGGFVDKKRALYANFYDHIPEKVLAYFKDFVDKIIKNPIQYKVKYGTTLKTAIIVDRHESQVIWKHTVQKSLPTYFPETSETSEAHEDPKEEFASEQEIKIALDAVEECYIANNGVEMPNEEYEAAKKDFSICNSKMLESMLQFKIKMINHLANPK
ncbi:hypothetical protein WAF17_02375 [Bernardetia sp. ABR2-2B]|uniref:hypothetical protein n=1 Tax=Bernardetia sp. ABR2-2B TaxID=3127472 RepID=UPI0030CD9760